MQKTQNASWEFSRNRWSVMCRYTRTQAGYVTTGRMSFIPGTFESSFLLRAYSLKTCRALMSSIPDSICALRAPQREPETPARPSRWAESLCRSGEVPELCRAREAGGI